MSLFGIMFGWEQDVDPKMVARLSDPGSWEASDRRRAYALEAFMGGGDFSHSPASGIPQPTQYGRVHASFQEGRNDRPLPGFRQMFLMPDGSVFSPTVNPPHTPIEFHCNGQWLYGYLDTCATNCVLNHNDARRIGINPRRLRYDDAVSTGKGRAAVAAVILPEMAIGPIRVRDVKANIMQGDTQDESLVGMSFIRRLSNLRIIEEGVLLYA